MLGQPFMKAVFSCPGNGSYLPVESVHNSSVSDSIIWWSASQSVGWLVFQIPSMLESRGYILVTLG